jgi:uncharacterized membrane protein
MSLRSDRSWWAGILLGVGLAAFVDEIVLHRLLQRHYFHDAAASGIGLVSDGLFHAFGWFAPVFGLVMAADASRRRSFDGRLAASGTLLGAGLFQLYDGVVQHRLLGLHRIRYGPDTVLHDRTWNAVAMLLVAAGCGLALAALQRRSEAG